MAENHFMQKAAFSDDHRSIVRKMLVAVASEIFLACATVVLLFVYFPLPVVTATAIAIPVFAIGSIFCWKGFTSAQVMLLVCLFITEFVIISNSGFGLFEMAVFFGVIDIVAIYLLSKI